MVEIIHSGRYPLDKVAPGLGQLDAPSMSLEQEDAKSSSSAFTRALTLDCATPSAFAACRKFSYSAAASVWMSDAREMRDPSAVGTPPGARSSVLNAASAASVKPPVQFV